MKTTNQNLIAHIIIFCLLISSCEMNITKEKTKPDFPIAKKLAVTSNEHGIERSDNYFWLRERENQDVTDYLNAENAYAEKELADVKALRESLFEEIKSRIAQTDVSAPYLSNGYMYYTRYEEGNEQPFYCRKVQDSKEEEIMLNANILSKDLAYFAIGSTNVSPNNKMIAYGEDTLSRRIYSIRFKNLTTGEYLVDVLEGTTGSTAWAKDNKTVFYTKKDPGTLREFQIFRHILGTPQSDDKMVFDEKDDTFYTHAYLSKSGDYIFINSGSTLTSEFKYLAADNPTGDFKVVNPRKRGLEYDVEHLGGNFYIRNNANGAKNFKISKAPISNPGEDNWTEVIPHRADTYIDGFEVFKDFLVLEERNNALTKLHVLPWKNMKSDHYISFKDPAYMAYISTNEEIDSEVLRYGYTSLTTPNSVFDYNMNTKESELIKQQEVIGDFDPENYTSERIFAESRDGTLVPISIVYRKGFKKDGKQPLLLYGYGSYGISMDAYFSSQRLSLFDRGFAFAIAHIRGGQEMGRDWYEDGKLLKKKNTFYDFIDCGKFLIEKNYTSSSHLYAMGGSAGGLLMGAVINMEPEMWNGIVAQVPFVDVINTMLDETIPLTTGEYDEWGNPNDKEYFEYIMSYSPYDNIKKQNYPSLLIATGLHDSQVQYWEPAKWTAKLRELKTDTNDLFLVTNMDTGHGGSSGRFERFKEVALEYAFLLRLEGIEQ
ncbi:S9 family peptidase [Cryomorpha ignava]|uniref:Proline-specific endopeptidase n=1 Tax=Cryomorpha ignava TaxID=101383 RepID=A0A7K3WKQ7_9FLAO|nr:S9 family peptidase [Cryomorpha ignava]NEN22118.1 S9 family peptidase [Cryomorpha ignava]